MSTPVNRLVVDHDPAERSSWVTLWRRVLRPWRPADGKTASTSRSDQP